MILIKTKSATGISFLETSELQIVRKEECPESFKIQMKKYGLEDEISIAKALIIVPKGKYLVMLNKTGLQETLDIEKKYDFVHVVNKLDYFAR